MRIVLILLAIGLGCAAAGLALAGRGRGHAAIGPVVAGVAVAFGAFMLVDCRQCASGALYVGALVSLPFAIVGWGILGFDPAGLSRGGALIVRAAALFQLAWAALVTATTTFGGACPCRALGWGDPIVPLAAVGFDKLVGPLLLVVALVTLVMAGAADRRRRAGGA